MKIKTGILSGITPYIYGTTRLGDDSIVEISKLQYRWSEDLDVKAEPWSM